MEHLPRNLPSNSEDLNLGFDKFSFGLDYKVSLPYLNFFR